jgi:ppGpp synthetase/RelA/SpoT-type nucleotidyltranferase
MDTKVLRQEYEEREDLYKELMNGAWYQLDHAIKSQKIKTHSIEPRIKPFDSFADKIRKNSLIDPFNEINDIVGLRVVCLFLSDLDKIGNIIKTIFELIDEDNKIDNDSKDIFGYMAIHYVVRLKTIPTGLQQASKTPFEIQVRTIVQDAWASISHHIAYKKDKTIPENLKRDFYALSGLFYVADQHFKMIEQESRRLRLKDENVNTGDMF